MINHGILGEIMMNYDIFFLTIAFDHILFACFPKVSIAAQVRFEGIRVSERLEKFNQVGIIGGNEWPQIGNGNHDRNYIGFLGPK